MTLDEWLTQAEKMQQSSRRKGMTRDTPTGQLQIALKIIRILQATYKDAPIAVRLEKQMHEQVMQTINE